MSYSKVELCNYLTEYYSVYPKKRILDELNLKWSYIQKVAHNLGISRSFNESITSFTCSRLSDYDNISCYWIGFILADGHINKNIQINLSIKDKDHILRIEDFLGICLKKYEDDTQIRIIISDRPTINKIVSDFCIVSNKTKNPPVIPTWFTDEQMFSLIVGFIDGDGSININGTSIQIKCDSSWKNILEEFHSFLTKDNKVFNITSSGCAIVYISKFEIIRSIKDRAKELKLPILVRKWSRIDDNRILKNDKQKIVRDMFLSGKDFSYISKNTRFSSSLIYRVKSEL